MVYFLRMKKTRIKKYRRDLRLGRGILICLEERKERAIVLPGNLKVGVDWLRLDLKLIQIIRYKISLQLITKVRIKTVQTQLKLD